MSLIDVNTLINELVPDQSISKNSKKVGVYAGSFKPPTKGHFAVVQKALRGNPDLDELNIKLRTITLPSDRTAKNFYEANGITARILLMEEKRDKTRYRP